MIKINLLGVAAPGPAPRERPPVTIGFQVGTLVGALIVCFLVVGVFYKMWSGAIDNLNIELKKEQAEQARLAAIKAENLRYQEQVQQLDQRINTIQALQASRVGPVEIMSALGTVVNKTSDVYLYTASNTTGRLALRGQAGSVESMAVFLASLKSSGVFDDVQLHRFFEDDQHGRLTYKFDVSCMYKPPQPPSTGTTAAPTATPGAPAGRTGM
ncbi:MAG: PilN domain-containing protein [Acidobacteriia bacterium]|nr:PilN domain-containing protein [Terriglobia bacterium]